MDMKRDPAKEEDSLSSPSDPEHALPVGPSCLTAENWLNIFNSIADPLMVLDNDYTILLANSSMATFVGLPLEEITGRKCYAVCHGTEAPVALCPKRRTDQDGKPHSEDLVEPRTGKPLQVTSSPVCDSAGVCSGTVHFIKDMSSHYSLLAMLKSSRDIYRSVVDEQTEILVRFDADGLITFANDVCCQMTGKPRQELLGARWDKKIRTDAAQLIEEKLCGLTRTSPLAAFECTLLDSSGGTHWVQFIARGLFDRSGTLTDVQLVGRDMTLSRTSETMNAELELRIARQAEIQRLAGERERCRIAGELHDQLAPNLLVCMMKLNALRADLTTASADGTVSYIEKLLNDTIQDIKSLTFQLRPPLLAKVGLAAALKWLASEFDEKYGLKVDFDDVNPWNQPDFALQSTLFQVVRELLLNVVKHAGTGHARLSLSRSMDQMMVCVEDDGIGCDSDSTAVFSAESGFGIFSIRQKIEHLGGVLSIDSSPGSGTRVTVTVPALSVENSKGS